MSDKVNNSKKLSLSTLVLIIFVATFGFRNITNNAVILGPAAIPSWIAVAILYFLPLSIFFAELASANRDKLGGIYSWIESGLDSNWAFIGTWSYFVSCLFYLQYCFARIPVIASWAIFGENRFTDSYAFLISILSIVICIFLTWLATTGVKKFSKISDFGGKFTFAATSIFIIFAIVGFFIGKPSATEFTAETLTPEFNISYFATFSWLLLAVFGAEVGGTYIHEIDKPEKNFTKGIFLATVVIAVIYILGSIALGLVISPEELATVGVKNADYYVIKLLAENWGLNGGIVIRIYCTIMFISSIAAYTIWIESPIRAMFSEVPKGTFPEILTKKDEKGTLHNALWIQCGIVVILMIVPMLGLDSVESLFVLVTDLTALSGIVPYIIFAAAYLVYRKNGNKAPTTIIKSNSVAVGLATLTLIIGIIAFIGEGLDYLIGVEDTLEMIKLLVKTYGGPVILIFVGFVIKRLSNKKYNELNKKNA